MEYLTISELDDRFIKLGWSRGERYADEAAKDLDPWWNFHLIIKKPGVDYDCVSESMSEGELRELPELIKKSRNFDIGEEECLDFIEPDYSLVLSKHHGILNINMKYVFDYRFDCLKK